MKIVACDFLQILRINIEGLSMSQILVSLI